MAVVWKRFLDNPDAFQLAYEEVSHAICARGHLEIRNRLLRLPGAVTVPSTQGDYVAVPIYHGGTFHAVEAIGHPVAMSQRYLAARRDSCQHSDCTVEDLRRYYESRLAMKHPPTKLLGYQEQFLRQSVTLDHVWWACEPGMGATRAALALAALWGCKNPIVVAEQEYQQEWKKEHDSMWEGKPSPFESMRFDGEVGIDAPHDVLIIDRASILYRKSHIDKLRGIDRDPSKSPGKLIVIGDIVHNTESVASSKHFFRAARVAVPTLPKNRHVSVTTSLSVVDWLREKLCSEEGRRTVVWCNNPDDVIAVLPSGIAARASNEANSAFAARTPCGPRVIVAHYDDVCFTHPFGADECVICHQNGGSPSWLCDVREEICCDHGRTDGLRVTHLHTD